jgi:hypothetical protein
VQYACVDSKWHCCIDAFVHMWFFCVSSIMVLSKKKLYVFISACNVDDWIVFVKKSILTMWKRFFVVIKKCSEKFNTKICDGHAFCQWHIVIIKYHNAMKCCDSFQDTNITYSLEDFNTRICIEFFFKYLCHQRHEFMFIFLPWPDTDLLVVKIKLTTGYVQSIHINLWCLKFLFAIT